MLAGEPLLGCICVLLRADLMFAPFNSADAPVFPDCEDEFSVASPSFLDVAEDWEMASGFAFPVDPSVEDASGIDTAFTIGGGIAGAGASGTGAAVAAVAWWCCTEDTEGLFASMLLLPGMLS